MKAEDIYYKALLARDHRFDGKFFVGVKTTRIYCRPICPARPLRKNVLFFKNHLDAEKSGFRPCLRCRPESAPESPAWMGKSAIVQRALRTLEQHTPLELDEDQFAERFGISARHLRRLFTEEIGKTPKQIARENRLNFSRKLIVETSLPITEIAHAAGFNSIRRFNSAFKERFKRAPKKIRRSEVSDNKKSQGSLELSISYRPPFDFDGLIDSYKNHSVSHLQWFEGSKMFRLVQFGKKIGTVGISNDSPKSQLKIEVDFSMIAHLHTIMSRVRNLFDLNSDPVLVANALETSPHFKRLLKKYPGIRLPSGWDPFETAIGTVLGQVVSLERGRKLVNDLVENLGEPVEWKGSTIRLFPTPKSISETNLDFLKTTSVRKQALRDLSKAIHSGSLSLDATQDVQMFVENLLKIRGIGVWSAQYMALKVLRNPDIFPEKDLVLDRVRKTLGNDELDRLAPWRGYAAALTWREYGNQ